MSEAGGTEAPATAGPTGQDQSAAGETPAGYKTARAQRLVKEADKLLKKNPEISPHARAMARVEQARVAALLELADAIRASKKS